MNFIRFDFINIRNICVKSHLLELRYFSKLTSTQKPRLPTPQQQLIEKLMQTNLKNMNLQKWRDYESEILKAGKFITPVNLDVSILNYCVKLNRLDVALEYKNYLKKQSRKMSVAAIGKLLDFYGRVFVDGAPHEEQIKIYKLYDELKSVTKYLDAKLGECVIEALSVTDRWRECEEIFNQINSVNHASIRAYTAFIRSAFAHDAPTIALDYLKRIQKTTDVNQVVNDPALIAGLNYASRHNDINVLREILSYLVNNEILISEGLAVKLTATTLKLNGDCQESYIKRTDGICSNCQTHLNRAQLNADEFTRLKNSFYQNVLLRKNIFTSTTKAELDRFHDFIASITEPFDIVIDGLNVAYSCGARQSPAKLANILSCVVNHFRQDNKRVLVFGRTHMLKWPQRQMTYIHENAKIFLAENLSQDDPFFLYAALSSGPETGILSRDLMRSHAYRLNDCAYLFHKWLYNVQYRLVHVQFDGSVSIKPPLKFVPSSQQNDDNQWHLTLKDTHAAPLYPSQVPKQWLCLKL